MIFNIGATSQSIDVTVVDDTGLPVTGLVAATFPALTYNRAGANADVTFVSVAAYTDLATITTAYSQCGIKERGNGVYRVDVPDGVFTSAGRVTIRGEVSGKHALIPVIDVQPPVNVTQLAGNTSAATQQSRAAQDVYSGSVTGTSTTTTIVDSGLTALTASLVNATVKFRTGQNQYQPVRVQAHTPGQNTLTVTLMSNVPQINDLYDVF